MQLIIICIIYALAVTALASVAVKTYLDMKAKNDSLHRQYFFTVLIFLFLLIVSFIAIILKLKGDVGIGDGSGSDILVGYSDKIGYGLISFIILLILGITAIILFDHFFLKKRSKTKQEYRTRQKLAVAVVIILIGIVAALKLIW